MLYKQQGHQPGKVGLMALFISFLSGQRESYGDKRKDAVDHNSSNLEKSAFVVEQRRVALLISQTETTARSKSTDSFMGERANRAPGSAE
ncbi:hypothetical protein CLOSTMETH_02969 [[Clostridium] methylpentosum DSM 5476]|uniref:Uncharacterized protein n=1 Tax=[Clostridium] methylpentosum DSM 5476 TaxID=537013 RepID=C0EGH6_9FIRM|nr:hypothetical protein CLOSTMETH_02969 [[Clostridium] methylpentosum DSM 5476]